MSPARSLVRVLRLVVSVVALVPAVAQAADVVDQHNDSWTPAEFSSIGAPATIGQEFIPTLTRIDFVQLTTAADPLAGRSSARLFVEIYPGLVTNTRIGISDTVTVVSSFDVLAQVSRFLFRTPVAVTAGNIYVFVVRIAGSERWYLGVEQGPQENYPQGRLIVGGRAIGYADAWFREGTSDVIAARSSTWGAIKSLYH